MTDETTVSATPEGFAPEREGVPSEQPKHRKKTLGEHVFNLSTYGGFTLLGNELSSTVIMQQTEPGKVLHKPFEVTKEKFSGALKGIKSNYIHEGRLNYILWACIGGFLMVWPVKALEDNKDKLVRKFDRMFHGGKDTPELEEAHKQMDHAPKQTWRSLGEGRLLVVFFAQVVDFLIGWPKAVSTQWADKTFKSASRKDGLIRDFASYERASISVSRFFVKHFDKKSREGIENVLATVHDVGERYKPQAAEGKLLPFVATATSLLSLSAVLTVMFYASSKLFAKKREEKIERKMHRQIMNADGTYSDAPDEVDAAQLDATQTDKPTSEKPTPQVKSITRENTISPLPELSQAV